MRAFLIKGKSMKLFKYECYRVVISEEALILKPFKKIWDRDKSKDKNKALQELAYIYFMEDPASDYSYLTDKEDRSRAIKEGEGLREDWEPDEDLIKAMSFYASFKSTSALMLEDTRIAVDNLRNYLRKIDLGETDDKGRPVHTISTVVSAIKQIPQLVTDLAEAEKAIAKEMFEQGRVRGQRAKSIFEDGVVL